MSRVKTLQLQALREGKAFIAVIIDGHLMRHSVSWVRDNPCRCQTSALDAAAQSAYAKFACEVYANLCGARAAREVKTVTVYKGPGYPVDPAREEKRAWMRHTDFALPF